MAAVRENLERKQRRLASLLARRDKKIRAQNQIIHKMRTLVELQKFKMKTGTKRRAPPIPTEAAAAEEPKAGLKAAAVSLKRQAQVRERPVIRCAGSRSPLALAISLDSGARSLLAPCQEVPGRPPARRVKPGESDGDSGHWSLGSPAPPRPFLRSKSYEKALEPEPPSAARSRPARSSYQAPYKPGVQQAWMAGAGRHQKAGQLGREQGRRGGQHGQGQGVWREELGGRGEERGVWGEEQGVLREGLQRFASHPHLPGGQEA